MTEVHILADNLLLSSSSTNIKHVLLNPKKAYETYGVFTLLDTETGIDTYKLTLNPTGICVGVRLCAV